MTSSPGNWLLEVDPRVLKTARKLPAHDAEKIREVIRTLPENLYGGDIQKMKGEENAWRRRVGNYRIFYKILPNQRIIVVFHLERRTSKTY